MLSLVTENQRERLLANSEVVDLTRSCPLVHGMLGPVTLEPMLGNAASTVCALN